VRIPGVVKSDIKEVEQVKTDTVPAVVEEIPLKYPRRQGSLREGP